MNRTTLLTAACLMMAAATTATAQTAAPAAPQAQARGMPSMGTARLQRLLQGITVSPQLLTQLDSIYARHVREIPAAAMGEHADSASQAQMHMHLGAADREARALLAPEQQQVFDRNLAALRGTGPMPPAAREQQ